MNSLLSPRRIRLIIPACGILGLLLRLLMAAGTDDRGLLRPGHPAWTALLVLTAAAAAAVVLCIPKIRGSGAYRISFPASAAPAAGNLLAAVSAAVSAYTYWNTGAGPYYVYNPLSAASNILGAAVLGLAPVVFLLLALCRRRGRKPVFGLHVLACIYFALQTLALYRSRSFDPQLQDYCFQLFACIALTMTAYQLAMFDAGRGSHRRLWIWGLAAVYLCCVSADSGPAYITGAVWAFTALSRLRRRRSRPQPDPVTIEEVYYPD